MKNRLMELLYEKSFKYSEEPVFRLVSGRVSNYYVNCKTVTLHPEGLYVIGNIIFDMIKDLPVNGVGGLTLGADPIADAVAYTSYVKGRPIEAFVVRKNAKSHGTMQWIEGNVKPGDGVVIVDDVITTGKSTIEAINRAKDAGLKILKVVALVDRQEGGYEAVAAALRDVSADYRVVEAVVTREELMDLHRGRSR